MTPPPPPQDGLPHMTPLTRSSPRPGAQAWAPTPGRVSALNWRALFALPLLCAWLGAGGVAGCGDDSSDEGAPGGDALENNAPDAPPENNTPDHDGPDEEPDFTQATSVEEALDLAGFEVGQGAAVSFQLVDCAELTECFANNASSPYLIFGAPPAPGAPPPPARLIGEIPRLDPSLSAAWHLGADEAVVIMGQTPPEVAYFSLAPYLFDRVVDGERTTLFASLSDALNHVTLAMGGLGFDSPMALVVAADEGVAEAAARAVRLQRGLPEAAVHVMPISPDDVRLGVDEEADSVMLLGRVALFDDPTLGGQWLESVETDWQVLRVTPRGEVTPKPFARPDRHERAEGVDESPLSDALDALDDAIAARHGAGALDVVNVTSARLIANVIDPIKCLGDNSNCLGDNGDTVYSAGPLSVIMGGDDGVVFDDEGFFVVFGVDHEASGNATYANAVLNWANTRAGVAVADSSQWGGGSALYLPDHPERDQLFAWRFARDCGGAPFCTSVPRTFPGVPDEGDVLFIFRAYLSPTDTVSTDPALMLTERVYWVQGSL